MATELDSTRIQEEQSLLQWNTMMAEKDSQIIDLQDKLDALLAPKMTSAQSREELESLSEAENGGLVAITKRLNNLAISIKVTK